MGVASGAAAVAARGVAGFWWQWVKKAVQSGFISGAGDLTAQYLLNGNASNRSSDASSQCAGPHIDQRRVASIATFSTFYSGIVQRCLYLRFDAWFGVCTAASTVTKKVALDTCVHAPLLYLPVFFLSTGLMQGKPLADSLDCLRTKYASTMLTYAMIWPGATFVMFRLVPEPSRVLFLAACSFVEKAFYSWVQMDGARTSARPGVVDAGRRSGWKDSTFAGVYAGSGDASFPAIGGAVCGAGAF
mmetsp:Transcript_65545/g.181710  ORF Transcript_65545/g.181710 Transcript_65545/m.181710 type:complete len:245 (-) Transcript_65545:159-893(-)